MAEQTNTETQVPSGDHAKAFPPFDSSTFAPQLVWLVICFTILYLILSRIAIPRIGEVLEQRQDRIQRDMDEASRLKEETDKAITTYEEALASARQKANVIADETRQKLNETINAENAEMDAKSAKKAEEAEANIRKAKETALADVNKIAAETTTTIIEKLLGQKPEANEVETALKS